MELFSAKRKPFAVLISILLLSLLATACGSASDTGSTTSAPVNGKGCTKVGVLLPETASSARWESKDRPLLDAAITSAIGTHPDIVNAEGDPTKQQSQAEADLTKGDCILVVGASDSAAAAAIVEKAKAKNVPVIAYDRLIQSKDLNYYVSFDNVRVGELQGQYIVDHHKKGDNVVMINGSQDDNNALLFKQGALNKLQPLFDSKELNLVYTTFTPKWDNGTAQTEMDAAITKTSSNIQIAYVANDGMANSVIASLKAKHLNGKVVVTGQDATVAGIQNILTGDQSMTVYKAITLEAKATADLVSALNKGDSTSSLTSGHVTATSDGGNIPSILETPVSVEKPNIADTVIKDGFVTKADICNGLPAGTNTNGICP
ncbi:MAG: substrate-binding domain-containing protein [Chloroflexota bacterium]|nr:substrate-binding domain-containing protein [Chloroflexota bacterium]